MNTQEVKVILGNIFGEIAPEINFETIDLHRPLRDQVEIDSYDFYRIIVKIAQATGVNIPDSKIPQFANLSELIDYISDQSIVPPATASFVERPDQ